MNLNLDDRTAAHLHKLAQDHNVTIDEMVQHLMHAYQAEYPLKPEKSSLSLEAIRYFGLFEQSTDAVFLLALDGKHIECNQRAADLLGYTPDELANLSAAEIVKPSEYGKSINMRQRLINGEKPALYQRILMHKDGTEIPVEINTECIFDELGNPLYIQSIARDIRERLMLMDSLSESERRFRAIFNTAFTFMGLMYPDGTLIEVNQTALDFAEITAGQAIGKKIWETVWFRNSKAVQEQMRQSVERAALGEFVRDETSLFAPDDAEITVDYSIKPVIDDDGNVVLLVPEARDISERKQMEQRLELSEQRYRTILSAMAEGLVIHDASGAITLVNPAAEEMLGLSFDQMRGLTPVDPHWRTIHDNGDPFPGETHPASISLSQGIPQENVVMGVYKLDASLTWLSINSIPTFDVDGTVSGAIVTFSDITDLKIAQKTAVRMAVERERVDIIARFIQAASHEFRTPLSIIGTSAYILRRKYGEETPEIILQTTQIDQQIHRINRLIKGLLLMAKIDAIVTFEKIRVVNLSLLIAEITPTFSTQLINKNQRLNFMTDAQEISIMGNKKYLVDAITAILENAIHFSPIDTEINMTLSESDADVILVVQDNGIGIAPEDMPYIFQRFWRKDLSHTQEGFGLGLSIAQRIIELHQGTIAVESTPDEGTQVVITLPKNAF